MKVDYSITEHIPVADHVYKFLVKRCGGDVYVATRNDIIGNIILSSLGKHSDVKLPNNNFSKIFNVVIRESSYVRSGVFVGVKSGHVFNKMIDQLFRDELYHHVHINTSLQKDKCLNGIRNFLKIYDITEDDIKLESLYRDFKRKKESIQQRIKVA